MSLDSQTPQWERLGAVLERIAGGPEDYDDFCQTYKELISI